MTPYFNQEVQDKLFALLNRKAVTEQSLAREVSRLEKTHRGIVYSNLLAILSNLHFPEKTARVHWDNILRRKNDLSSCLGRDVDFRVALLDYFLHISKKMKNPVIIEIKVFQKTKTSSIVDELTGLYNFRFFQMALEKEESRAARYNSPFSLLMFDVDDFKDFNDHHGHLAGNDALRKISRILKANVRGVDVVARYGGEEFAVILPETHKQGALVIADRIRKKVEKEHFQGDSGKQVRLSVSGGVATYLIDAKKSEDLIRRADSALYVAKSQGKNCIHVYLNERRAFSRLSSSIIGSYWIVSSDYHTFQAKNVSHNGILFETDKFIPLGTILEMKVTLNGHHTALKARVARTEEVEKGKFDIGARILDMNKRDRSNFNKMLRSYQSAVP